MYIVLLALLLLLCVITVFFSFCYVNTVCGFTTEYLDLIDRNYCNAAARRMYEYVFVYTCLLLLCSAAILQLLLLAAACCCLLLLFVIVCRMAKKNVSVVHCI